MTLLPKYNRDNFLHGLYTISFGPKNVRDKAKEYLSRLLDLSTPTNTGGGITITGPKNPPDDSDKVIYQDNINSTFVTSTWTQIKSFLLSYFNNIYAVISHDHDTQYSPIGHTHSQYLTDAPNDGTLYGRKNGAWEAITITLGFIPFLSYGINNIGLTILSMQPLITFAE